MPTIRERDPSRPFTLSNNGADLTRPLVVTGTADEDEVSDLVRAYTTVLVGSLVRRAIKAQPQGGGVWFVDVEYGVADVNQALGVDPVEPVAPGPLDALGPDYSFDLGAQTLHITQSLKTMTKRAAADVIASGVNLATDAANQFLVTPDGFAVGAGDVGKLVRVTGGAGWTTGLYTILAQNGTAWTLDAAPAAANVAGGAWQLLTADTEGAGSAPDQKKAIGITRDRIEGCDVYAPVFSWQRTVPVLKVDLNFVNRIYRTIGKTNNAAFYGFARGEVLYLGCSGKTVNGRRWDVTHQFLSSPNVTNLDITDTIIVPSKRGWDYLWVGYEPEVSGNNLLQVPKAAYVERVYRETDFTQIGIGAQA